MNARIWSSIIAGILIASLISRTVPAQSPTGNRLISDVAGLWLVEISAQSFVKIASEIGEYDSLRGTIERIKEGFRTLEAAHPEATSLGFHWHDEHDKSMCELYRVKTSTSGVGRELVTDTHYATIEEKQGSCRDNGIHLRQLVSFMSATNQFSATTMWAIMMSQAEVSKGYSPVLASIDDVWIPVGMVPMVGDIERSDAWVPIAEWKEVISGDGEEVSLTDYVLNWKGIEAYADTPTIDIVQWQDWLKVVGPQIGQYSKVADWGAVRSFADTPPINIDDWQYWMMAQADEGAQIMSVGGWMTVKSLEALGVDAAVGELERAVTAAKVSQEVYGTPAYGMVVSLICPPEYLAGITNCTLPEFEGAKFGAASDDELTLLRVPFFRK